MKHPIYLRGLVIHVPRDDNRSVSIVNHFSSKDVKKEEEPRCVLK